MIFIISKKIPLKVMTSEKHLLQKLTANKYKKYNKKVLLVEDFILQSIFE